ncbi:galactonate dehydratase [Pseudactinotalea sp. Z1732]|uniref:galactonate dehydratase n=1 Tax=Micrococcales TaxID=85006 RepID=UPI003C7A89B8
MPIQTVETFLAAPRWLFVRLETTDGVVGWGESSLEGHGETAQAAVHAFEDILIGADHTRIEQLWGTMTRSGFYRGGPVFSSAVSGVDQALWDIRGKELGVPVHDLLGGAVRDKIRVYGWVGGDNPGGVREAVQAVREAGLTAVKMNATGPVGHLGTLADTRGVIERAGAAREALGDDGDFALDFHGRVSLPYARRLLAALEDLHPLFVEEPVLPEHTSALGTLVAGTSIPIATGERLYSRGEMRTALEAGVGVVQPDLAHAGGISEVRRIAAQAETYDAALAPHCPLGPLALAASLQVDFASPNAMIQEQSIGIHYNTGSNELLDYVLDTSVFEFSDGYIHRPTGPGLGVQIDENVVRELGRHPHRWRTPRWHREDGSIAEW